MKRHFTCVFYNILVKTWIWFFFIAFADLCVIHYSAVKLMISEILILTFLFFLANKQCPFICYSKIRLLQTYKLLLWDLHALTKKDKKKSSNLWSTDCGSVLLKHYCLLMGSLYQAHSIFITYKWYEAYSIIYLLGIHVVFQVSEYPGNLECHADRKSVV